MKHALPSHGRFFVVVSHVRIFFSGLVNQLDQRLRGSRTLAAGPAKRSRYTKSGTAAYTDGNYDTTPSDNTSYSADFNH